MGSTNHGSPAVRPASSQRAEPAEARSLQQELARSLTDALSQLQQLGRPSGRRAREAQRRAQAFVESALLTTESLIADSQLADLSELGEASDTSPPAQAVAALPEQATHALALALASHLKQLSAEGRAVPRLSQRGSLPELPRVVQRAITEACCRLLDLHVSEVSALELAPQPHGLCLTLHAFPAAEALRPAALAGESAYRSTLATQLALVGARLDARASPGESWLARIVWPARNDEAR